LTLLTSADREEMARLVIVGSTAVDRIELHDAAVSAAITVVPQT
jgi:hypothetical protein